MWWVGLELQNMPYSLHVHYSSSREIEYTEWKKHVPMKGLKIQELRELFHNTVYT